MNGEEVVVAKETADCLARAFARVSEPQRAALQLVRGEGLSVAAAAAALGTTATGVKLRTHRACRALRAELASDSRRGVDTQVERRLSPASAPRRAADGAASEREATLAPRTDTAQDSHRDASHTARIVEDRFD